METTVHHIYETEEHQEAIIDQMEDKLWSIILIRGKNVKTQTIVYHTDPREDKL